MRIPNPLTITFKNPLVDERIKLDYLKFFIGYSIFFPYVPALVPSDTQPTFMLLVGFSVIYLLLKPRLQSTFYNWSYLHVFVVLAFVAYSLFVVYASVILVDGRTQFGKYIGFLQFVLAVFYGVTMKSFFSKDFIKKILLIYLFFTGIYYITGGLVESLLILSRGDMTDHNLSATGRGARTLSAEPSFYALHILNILVVYFLIFGWRLKEKTDRIIFYTGLVCMASSFSGFAFVSIMIMLGLRYMRFTLILIFFGIVFSGYIVETINEYLGIRMFKLIAYVMENPELVLQGKGDQSAMQRIDSFLTYFERFQKYFLLGDGFSLKRMGGFISILTSLGLAVIFFYFLFIFDILRLKGATGRLKVLLVFWVIFYTISGSIGIPLIGIIIGLIIRRNYLGAESDPLFAAMKQT